MPFFSMRTPEEIKMYCKNQSLGALRDLNHRYGKFFDKIGTQEDLNNQKIEMITQQINKIRQQIEENATAIEEAEGRRKDILDNLPENGAERYLVLQHVNYHVIDDRYSLENRINELNAEKRNLNQSNAWIRSELHSCVQELKIVNAVIREKELAEKPRFESPNVSR